MEPFKIQAIKIDKLISDRLLLVPYTVPICKGILNGDFSILYKMGYKKGITWPDNDVLETVPRIIDNLSKVEAPTGFESWLIIKKDTMEIIGDAGFKGYNFRNKNIDIGYGIIKEERRKGYAEEAVKELINWAFSNEIINEITANCHLENKNSINLLKKFNFIPLNTIKGMIYWKLERKNFGHNP